MRGDRVKASGQETLMEVMAVATALDQEVSTGTETREHLGLGDRSAEGGGAARLSLLFLSQVSGHHCL